MPTLTAVRGESKKREAGANVDFTAFWDIYGLLQDEVTIFVCVLCYTSHVNVYAVYINLLPQGKGVYGYVGIGDGSSEEGGVGQLRTQRPLDPQIGPSSLEITILDTGMSVTYRYTCLGLHNMPLCVSLLYYCIYLHL